MYGDKKIYRKFYRLRVAEYNQVFDYRIPEEDSIWFSVIILIIHKYPLFLVVSYPIVLFFYYVRINAID